MPRRSWRLTVRTKVTAGTTLVLALAVVVAATTAAGLLRRALATDVQTSLDNRVDDVEGLVDSQQLTVILAPTSEDIGQVQVLDGTGAVVSVTPGLAVTTRLDVIRPPAAGHESTATVDGARIDGTPGTEYRIIARTVPSATGPLTIYAAASLAAARRAEAHLRRGMWLGLPLVVALAAWLIWWVVGRALAPVDAMRAEVDRIEVTDLSARVQPGGNDSEIARLGVTLNRMLDRLHDAATRQQLFAASASHELRSPLSAIRTGLEVGLAYPERADWPAIATDSLIEISRLESLARDLRTLTRSLSTGPATTNTCDLWIIVNDEIARRRPNLVLQYRTEGGSALVRSDADPVVQLVRNLLDNAERHAVTKIEVNVSSDAQGTTMRVANDGEPIAAGMRERIFEPFVRLDEARSLDSGGSGLGLAVARAIASDRGGTLVAGETDDGAEFRLWLPPATVHG